MAKDKASGGKSTSRAGKIPKQIAGVKIPKGLRDTGNAALKLAQSPAGRELLAAGLAAAAAAVAANSRVRRTAQQSGREFNDTMTGAVDAAAQSAGKIGTAFVEAVSAAARQVVTPETVAPRTSDAAAGPEEPVPVVQEAAAPAAPSKPSNEKNPRAAPAKAAASRRSNGATGKPARVKASTVKTAGNPSESKA